MSSTDATPDNSPPNSPPSLPPPKAKRQAIAKPRKPRPPKELIVKPKAPVPPEFTKRRTVATAQPKKKVPKEEKLIVDKLPKKPKERIPKAAAVPLVPMLQVKRKKVPQPQETTESDRELELSISDEERQIALQVATTRLEELLEETTTMVDELQKEEEEVRRLQDEKMRLLDELLVCEGLAGSALRSLKCYFHGFNKVFSNCERMLSGLPEVARLACIALDACLLQCVNEDSFNMMQLRSFYFFCCRNRRCCF